MNGLEGLLMLALYILGVAVIVYVVHLLLNQLGLSDPIRTIVLVIIAIVVLILVLRQVGLASLPFQPYATILMGYV